MSEETVYLTKMLITAGIVTCLLRAFPFLVFGFGKKSSGVIEYLGHVLSPAAIVMLVYYCLACYLRDRPPMTHMFGAAEAAASILVIGLQLWKKNPLLSIIAGTALYMVLVQKYIP